MNIQRPDLNLSRSAAEIGRENKPLPDKVQPEAAQIRQLAEDFEALFHQIVLKSMRDSVPKSGFVDGKNGEEVFRSMLDGEYAKNLAAQRQGGLADAIERQLLAAGQTKPSIPLAGPGLARYQAASLPAPTEPATMDIVMAPNTSVRGDK